MISARSRPMRSKRDVRVTFERIYTRLGLLPLARGHIRSVNGRG